VSPPLKSRILLARSTARRRGCDSTVNSFRVMRSTSTNAFRSARDLVTPSPLFHPEVLEELTRADYTASLRVLIMYSFNVNRNVWEYMSDAPDTYDQVKSGRYQERAGGPSTSKRGAAERPRRHAGTVGKSRAAHRGSSNFSNCQLEKAVLPTSRAPVRDAS